MSASNCVFQTYSTTGYDIVLDDSEFLSIATSRGGNVTVEQPNINSRPAGQSIRAGNRVRIKKIACDSVFGRELVATQCRLKTIEVEASATLNCCDDVDVCKVTNGKCVVCPRLGHSVIKKLSAIDAELNYLWSDECNLWCKKKTQSHSRPPSARSSFSVFQEINQSSHSSWKTAQLLKRSRLSILWMNPLMLLLRMDNNNRT